MSVALKIENVSKMYRLGTVGTGTLSHDLNRWWAKLRGRPDPTLKIGMENNRAESGGDYVWALKDINVEVQQGEILGIIGRNGAGKSTLLKLLSRVTAPTTGSIKARGRTASLLEVGTGFHPELTGRENIYLNGAIMGMTREEITRRLDEIVDFSGCAKYIDTPVKRFSSGMTVRLGFAVAAHLDCEILIVDEVLAVGDVDFQRRCIGKMGDVAKSGRTVLVVSHQMSLISMLCSRAIVMLNGGVIFDGSAKSAISEYVREQTARKDQHVSSRQDRKGDGSVRFVNVEYLDENDQPLSVVITGKPFTIKVELESTIDEGSNVVMGIGLKRLDQQYMFHLSNKTLGQKMAIRKGTNVFRFELPSIPLRAGFFQLNLFCEVRGVVGDWIQDVGRFQIEEGDFFGSGQLPPQNTGQILVPFRIS